jgi:hypothetical protein
MKNLVMRSLLAGLIASGSIAVGSGSAVAQTSPLAQLAGKIDRGEVATSYAQFRHRGFRGRGFGHRGFYGGPRYRGGYHRRGGIGAGAVIGGLAAGALIGGAIASQAAPAPVYGSPVPDDATAYCLQRFKSYDPASGTYLGYDGLRHPCP